MFRALSSSLVQRYNIFPRNPNCVNVSQHFGNVKNAVFYLEFIMMAVSMNGHPRPYVIQKELALLEDAPTSANSIPKSAPRNSER